MSKRQVPVQIEIALEDGQQDKAIVSLKALELHGKLFYDGPRAIRKIFPIVKDEGKSIVKQEIDIIQFTTFIQAESFDEFLAMLKLPVTVSMEVLMVSGIKTVGVSAGLAPSADKAEFGDIDEGFARLKEKGIVGARMDMIGGLPGMILEEKDCEHCENKGTDKCEKHVIVEKKDSSDNKVPPIALPKKAGDPTWD